MGVAGRTGPPIRPPTRPAPPCPAPPSIAAAESDARSKGIQRLVLLTTRTADWFEQRGFRPEGPAHASALLPEARRAKIDPSRNSLLFAKQLL